MGATSNSSFTSVMDCPGRTPDTEKIAHAELRSFVLFFALGIHSIMEGLGLGASTNAGLLISIMAAIFAHKGLAAFALGTSLSESGISHNRICVFVMLFSLGTPLGCFIGLLAEVSSSANKAVTSGIFMAVASGTFLQVSCMELLPPQL